MQETDKKEEPWEPLARAFLRGVEDHFSIEEFREALGLTGVKAPLDGYLIPWIRKRGWESRRPKPYANVRWHRMEGCLDQRETASLRS